MGFFFFLQHFRKQMGISAISYHYFVATFSRTNGNLTQNACSKNENGIPFVRERTVVAIFTGSSWRHGRGFRRDTFGISRRSSKMLLLADIQNRSYIIITDFI